MEIIFATQNEHKLREARAILPGHSIRSMAEAGLALTVLEDGDTFEANALKKSEAVARAGGLPTLADDSGLEIDFLQQRPGVHSARFLGEQTPYSIKNATILGLLQDAPWEQRTARYVCVMAYTRGGATVTARGVLEGHIAWACAGAGGFGYDPIFYLPAYGRTVAELPPEVKNRISHRALALAAIVEKIGVT
jgi:XTP/dITP diphosphohydrolase